MPADAPRQYVTVANALIVGSPLTEDDCRAAMAHYRALADLLRVSGPRFANAQRDAIDLHNRAVQRLREGLAERQARERRAAEAAEGLTELPNP